LFAGRRVLEVACGTGHWTQFLAPVAAGLVGIDAAEETLHIARARVGNDNVRFLLGDAYDLPSDLGVFDAAFAGFWYSHVPMARQREFLGGLAARLSPGARLVMLDNRQIEGSSTPISEHDADGNTYQQRRLDDGSTHRVLKNFPSEAQLRAAVEGFADEFELKLFPCYWALNCRIA
jgi:demethylmenaquinone methyltransferase/2-methoxy-6-polyprenyl-1,4-benzoquinol methylase